MKNQYFGDIDDYKKYALLRTIASVTGLPIGICWMLTKDDSRQDGEKRGYLDQPELWQHFDPELFATLGRLKETKITRNVSLAKQWNIIPEATYFDQIITDNATERELYFVQCQQMLRDCPVIFFDPDNGLDVKSVPEGKKNSSKYIYIDELVDFYSHGHSLLTYQHFPRIERKSFIQSCVKRIRKATGCIEIIACSTPFVLFLLAVNKSTSFPTEQLLQTLSAQWKGEWTVTLR